MFDLNETQLTTYNYLLAGTRAVYSGVIITEDANGSLHGPFGLLMHTPKIAENWINLQLGVTSLLTPTESEAAVLGVLSVTKAAYGIYAHAILAERAGYTAAQVKAMLAGTCPSGITKRQAACWTLAVKLAQTRGPLDSVSFQEASDVLGTESVAAAIHQAAAFMYTSIMLNAGDVGLPAGVEL
ncbi:Carboxymuconolactone decarboxylase-like protein [Rutstroemia sp. NJR-2017a BVV2]|nr:Carboxymuconolactone decarboxylase-like protein [Rutstroemia sp. NJR-2017a BVV2]